jgi:hypothetical protein
VISLSFVYPTNQWLTINGTLTLVGDLTLVVNAGTWPNNGTTRCPPLLATKILPNTTTMSPACALRCNSHPGADRRTARPEGQPQLCGRQWFINQSPTFLTCHDAM